MYLILESYESWQEGRRNEWSSEIGLETYRAIKGKLEDKLNGPGSGSKEG